MKDYKIFKIESLDKTQFHVSLAPDREYTFISQLDNLFKKYKQLIIDLGLSSDDLVFVKIFVSDSLNQKEQMKTHPLFEQCFINCGFSIIEQPPLDGNKINMLLWFIKKERINKYKLGNAFYLEMDGYKHIFHCVRSAIAPDANLIEQTQNLFEQHKALIQKDGMTFLDNCVRTWVYIKDIDKDYSCIVKGRNKFFEQNGLSTNTHFIASTGIGGSSESALINLGIDFYSIKGIKQEQIKYLEALDYLSPTYEYGVAFERGICISYPDIKNIFISGTASIDKEGHCIYLGDIIKQLVRVFLNIKKLLNTAGADFADIAQMIIYVRDISDSTIIHKFMENDFCKVPYVIVLAKICRPEWLIEVECLALKVTGW
jgi:enamine deaminase RidA (YjgF/YER057c/UK114 family)